MFFSDEMILALKKDNQATLQGLKQRFLDLHQSLVEQMRLNDIQLHNILAIDSVVQTDSVSDRPVENVLSIAYSRSKSQAVNVERLMGREEIANVSNIEARRHPVIELRLSPEQLAVELLMSPDAWWDQQNLIGKLSVTRHKQEFHSNLQNLRAEYRLGFWKGAHLSEMHLRAAHFQHFRIVDEWMSTFQANADWFRLGIWYDLDAEELSEERIVEELMQQIRALYPIYTSICWTSDNNFREFHAKSR